MTKGSDRRARAAHRHKRLLPATHKAPAQFASSAILSCAHYTTLLPRQRASLLSLSLLILVSSRLISLCRFFRVPLFVTAALSLSIIFCYFFFFFFFLLRYGLRRFITRNKRLRLLVKIIRSLLNPFIYHV